jgi:uncharacterized protein YggE
MKLFTENKHINFKAILTAFVATIITVGSGIWVTSIVGPVPISITQTLTKKQTAFNVNGESEVVSIPDQAKLTLGITVTKPNASLAQEKANQVINSIIKELKKMDIDQKDIVTQSYQLYPQYDFNNGKRQIVNYNLNASLRVTLKDFDKLNQVIDKSILLGANQVNGIEFSLSKEKKDKLIKQARKEAIKDAKRNAAELADLSGIKLGKIINITQTNQNTKPISIYEGVATTENLAQDIDRAPTQIQPGSSVLKYKITLSYETL